MANTNNLEFLGREGLTTLLAQVNENTQAIANGAASGNDTPTKPGAGTGAGGFDESSCIWRFCR